MKLIGKTHPTITGKPNRENNIIVVEQDGMMVGLIVDKALNK